MGGQRRCRTDRRNGEIQTAAVLDELARKSGGDLVVLHDLAIPIPGFTANIDHVVISGSQVLLVDTKAWAAGFYWTVGGTTRRGWKPFPSADKKTMATARDAITRFVAQHRVDATVRTPVVAIWPTGHSKPTRTGLLKIPGATTLLGPKLARIVKRFSKAPADPQVVNTLLRLVNGKRPASTAVPMAPVSGYASDDFGPPTPSGVPAVTAPPPHLDLRSPGTVSPPPAPVNTGWLDPNDPFAVPFTAPAAPMPTTLQPSQLPAPQSPAGQLPADGGVDWSRTDILSGDDF